MEFYYIALYSSQMSRMTVNEDLWCVHTSHGTVSLYTTDRKRRPGTDFTDARVDIKQRPHAAPVEHVEQGHCVCVQVTSKKPVDGTIHVEMTTQEMLAVDDDQQTDVANSEADPAVRRWRRHDGTLTVTSDVVDWQQVTFQQRPRTAPIEDGQRTYDHAGYDVVDQQQK